MFKSPLRRFALNSQELRLEGKPPSSLDLQGGSRAGTRGGSWLAGGEMAGVSRLTPGSQTSLQDHLQPWPYMAHGTGDMVHLHDMKHMKWQPQEKGHQSLQANVHSEL